jgi:hypothetical protein
VVPRSVMSPVTSRRGVTSKAGLPTGLPGGTTSTRAGAPAASRPATQRTSSPARSSIGISAGSPTVQSMLGDGSAT